MIFVYFHQSLFEKVRRKFTKTEMNALSGGTYDSKKKYRFLVFQMTFKDILLQGEIMEEQEMQLKELYDSLNEEDKRDREELEYLRDQQRKINLLLDNLGVPRRGEDSMLSISERVEIALKRRAA